MPPNGSHCKYQLQLFIPHPPTCADVAVFTVIYLYLQIGMAETISAFP